MSTAAPTAKDRPKPTLGRISAVMAARPIALALVVTALLTAVRLGGTVDSDVAWQLWIAGRIHVGANLYRDIIETNPPLWFWMAVPVERLASLLHLRIEAVLIVTMGSLAALSLAATSRHIGHIEPSRRALLLAYAALALTLMPWMHIGQREQIVLMATLPYAALIAARREGRDLRASTAAPIGIGAGLAFALKHYFLIVPAALELWLLIGDRRAWRPLRSETIAVTIVCLAYAASVALLEPDFLTTIVPLLRLAYGAFGAPSISYLFGPLAVVGLALLAVLLCHAGPLLRREAPFAAALAVAATVFALIYFIQFKGWRYHAIPLVGCASVGIAALLAECRQPLRLLRLLGPALLILPLFLALDEQRQPGLPTPELLAAVDGLKPGEPVAFLTTETAVPWSVTLQGGYRYASRYNGFWMLPAIVENERRGNPNARVATLGRQIVSNTVDDLSCIPPKRIIVARPRPGEQSFDILPFFLRDQHFGALLSHYRVVSRTGLETYEIAFPFPRRHLGCRTGV